MTTTSTRPTLRAAYYVNWLDVVAACGLTPVQREDMEAILDHFYTWGDAEITLADVGVVQDALREIMRTHASHGEDSYQEAIQISLAYMHATEGAVYVNLEATTHDDEVA